jgi:hypothetical protein
VSSRVTQTCFSTTLLGYCPNDLRRDAQKKGVRPLRLHDARHTYASLALASGKSVRWVAGQLGHASPELTLRVYAHALKEEETDLSFLDFAGTGRHPRGTRRAAVSATRRPPRATSRKVMGKLARREGEQAQLASKPPWSLRSHSPLALRSRLPLKFEA